MNLQVVSPYKKCPFGCPMCIAATDYKYPYMDNYNYSPVRRTNYLAKLHSIKHDYDTFVLTGDTEPTLFYDWLQDVGEVLQGRNVELQTKNYNVDLARLPRLTTLAYSITNTKEFSRMPYLSLLNGIDQNNRVVILMTRELDFALSMLSMREVLDLLCHFNQVTFKRLQPSQDPETQARIKIMQPDSDKNFNNVVATLNLTWGKSARIDDNCMDAEGRYKIFRCDGQLYNSWF